MSSPLCTVNGSSTLNGVNVTATSTFTIALADTAGVKQWSIRCLTTDELLVASSVTAGLTVNNTTKVATGTAPSAGSALVFQSQVNNGLDANGHADPSLTTTFGVFVLTSSGYRVGAFNETTEGSASCGWVTKFNALARSNNTGAWPTDISDTRLVRGFWSSDAAANYTIGSFSAANLILGKIVTMVCDGTDLPHGSILTGVSVGVAGKSGHAPFPGGKPTMPALDLVAWDSTNPAADPVSVIGGPVVDPSTTAGAFETAHTISKTGLAVTIDATRYLYAVLFLAEAGGSGLVGDAVFAPRVTFTHPTGTAIGRG